jgi:hypothetical protein
VGNFVTPDAAAYFAKMRAERKARDDTRAAFVASHGERPALIPAFHRADRERRRPYHVMVARSVREPGKWQATYFDDRGPWSHVTGATFAKTIAEAHDELDLDFGAAVTPNPPRLATHVRAPGGRWRKLERG